MRIAADNERRQLTACFGVLICRSYGALSAWMRVASLGSRAKPAGSDSNAAGSVANYTSKCSSLTACAIRSSHLHVPAWAICMVHSVAVEAWDHRTWIHDDQRAW